MNKEYCICSIDSLARYRQTKRIVVTIERDEWLPLEGTNRHAEMIFKSCRGDWIYESQVYRKIKTYDYYLGIPKTKKVLLDRIYAASISPQFIKWLIKHRQASSKSIYEFLKSGRLKRVYNDSVVIMDTINSLRKMLTALKGKTAWEGVEDLTKSLLLSITNLKKCTECSGENKKCTRCIRGSEPKLY